MMPENSTWIVPVDQNGLKNLGIVGSVVSGCSFMMESALSAMQEKTLVTKSDSRPDIYKRLAERIRKVTEGYVTFVEALGADDDKSQEAISKMRKFGEADLSDLRKLAEKEKCTCDFLSSSLDSHRPYCHLLACIKSVEVDPSKDGVDPDLYSTVEGAE